MKRNSWAATITAVALLSGIALPALAVKPAASGRAEAKASSRPDALSVAPGLLKDGSAGTSAPKVPGAPNIVKDLGKVEAAKVEKLRERGLRMIEERSAQLNKRLEAIASNAKLSADDKSLLESEIQQLLAGLSALWSTVEQESDAQALLLEVRSIVSDYRVYMVVLPKGVAMQAAANASWGAQRFDVLIGKIQARIDELKAGGADVSGAQALLDGMKAKIADAKAAIAKARTDFSSMTPQSAKGARNLLATGKADLRQAQQDFKAAIRMVTQIRQILNGLSASSTEDTATAE